MKKIENQYIVQAIIVAANNLRLSSEKIEIISVLKEYFSECENIGIEITKMKKITALSKFGIKLGQLYTYITSSNIDFMKVTENFKEQSHLLVLELSNLLELVTPNMFRELLQQIKDDDSELSVDIKPTHTDILDNIELDKTENEPEDKEQLKINFEEEIQKNEEIKKEIIYDTLEDKKELDFEDFEKNVVDTVKSLEELLKRIIPGEYEDSEIEYFIEQLGINRRLSLRSGFSIISDLHLTVETALEKIIYHQVKASEETIEGIRACLIVVVAVVREKDVDISSYLKRAKKFGKFIDSIN